MAPEGIRRWIAAGLWGLPAFGALTLWSSLEPQPDPATETDAWARFVTTDAYVLSHLLGSVGGLILSIFGSVALAARLAPGPAGRTGMWGMVLAVLGAAIFLPLQGMSTFAAPWEGQAHLAGVEGLSELPDSFATTLMGALALPMVALSLAGNLALGVAVWRSGTLPRWGGGLWVAGHVLMYVLGLVLAGVLGSAGTPPTVPLGAALLVVGGVGIAWGGRRG